MTARLLRAAAVLIAVAGFADPAVTTVRTVPSEVAVVTADSTRDGALAGRVARALGDDVRVLRAPFAGAAASVVVGSSLPPGADGLATPAFVVRPDDGAPHAHFERVTAPATAPLDAAIPIDAVVHVTGTAGPLEVALSADGLVVDRIVGGAAPADERHRVRLRYVPVAAGAVALRLTATVDGVARAAADAVVDVRADRWSVLFHDPRPSWQSTFVRRTLERDTRFDVASRVVTSRDASLAAGPAPPSLADAAALARFDAVVVGAPAGLREADVAGIETYLRTRGGSVILLYDDEAAGPIDGLTGAAAWQMRRVAAGVPVADEAEADTIRASELRTPRALPPGAAAIARDDQGRAVVWRAPVGAGRLLVSGALDAWRFRDPDTSDFDAFWRDHIADAAAAAPGPLTARLEDAVVAPGATTDLVVTLRDLVLADASVGTDRRARMSATIDDANGSRQLRVWPEGQPGQLRARVRAPDAPGLYRVRVSSGASTAETVLGVVPAPARATLDRPALLDAWAAARGGVALSEADVGGVADALARTIAGERRRATWHPLRSAWWIVPFTLLLGAEWWWRRRQGQA